MNCKRLSLLLPGLLVVIPVLAQQAADGSPVPCTIEPVFHCSETLDDGGIIAHFGYRAACLPGTPPGEGATIEIGPRNFFSPGPADRGQPKVFVPGDHVDEFEVEYSAAEAEGSEDISWTVLDSVATVSLLRTKDDSLDCNKLPY